MSDADVEYAALQSITPEKFLNHFRDIQEAKTEASDVNMGVARARKAAKRDGVDLNVLATIERLAAMTEGESAAYLGKLHMYATWLKMPLGAFAAGLPTPAEPKADSQANFEAWQALGGGKQSAIQGSSREANPHMPATRNYVAWDKGWSAGFKVHQKKIAEGMTPSRMKKDAAPSAGEIADAVSEEIGATIAKGRGAKTGNGAQTAH